MSDAIHLVSRRQKIINDLMSEVDKISDDGLFYLYGRLYGVSESYPRYPSKGAVIISLEEIRAMRDKVGAHRGLKKTG